MNSRVSVSCQVLATRLRTCSVMLVVNPWIWNRKFGLTRSSGMTRKVIEVEDHMERARRSWYCGGVRSYRRKEMGALRLRATSWFGLGADTLASLELVISLTAAKKFPHKQSWLARLRTSVSKGMASSFIPG